MAHLKTAAIVRHESEGVYYTLVGGNNVMHFWQSYWKKLVRGTIIYDIYNGIIIISFVDRTLLKFFDSFPDNHCQKVMRQLGKSHTQWLIHIMRCSARYCGILNLLRFSENFRKVVCSKHCKYKGWVFFQDSRGMNRSAEQTYRGSRDLFVPRSDSLPMNQEKRQSFLESGPLR